MKTTALGTVVSVYDGDTLRVDLTFGFGVLAKAQTVQLAGLNARELNEEGGPEAKAALQALLPEGLKVAVVCEVSTDGIHRYPYQVEILLLDADAYLLNVNHQMILQGFAVEWDGKGERPVPAWPRPGHLTTPAA